MLVLGPIGARITTNFAKILRHCLSWCADPNRIIAIFTVVLALAALGSLRISQDTAKRQLRAYVGVAITTPPNPNTFYPPYIPAIYLTLRNAGQTPAFHTLIQASTGMLKYPLSKDTDFSVPIAGPVQNATTVFPGNDPPGIVNNTARPLTMEEIAAIRHDSAQRLVAFGRSTYEDVFRERHYTN